MKKHAHCGYCGHAFAPGQPWPRQCASCARTTYVNPTPVAVCLLPINLAACRGEAPLHGRSADLAACRGEAPLHGRSAENGLLCVRRAIPPGVGQLALPGGYIDFAETWQQAAARELFEETGLRIDAGEIEHVRTLSSDQGDGILLVFGRARPRSADTLTAFVPTAETSELVVLREPAELAFPLHTQVVAEFFAHPAQS